MGTRNLTMVRSNGELKIAQYGQWDGNPSGQGETILQFILSHDMKEFSKKLKETKFLREEEKEQINKKIKDEEMKLPISCSRDTGAEILNMVYENPKIELVDESDFLNDGLFCEFAYCIDLDKEMLIVYDSGNVWKEIPISELKQDTMQKLEAELREED